MIMGKISVYICGIDVLSFMLLNIYHFFCVFTILTVPENRFTTAVQLLKIDYNRVLEGPKGSEHLLSPSMKEYLARVSSYGALCELMLKARPFHMFV